MKHILVLLLSVILAAPMLAQDQAATEPDTSQTLIDGLEVRPFAYFTSDDFDSISGDGAGVGISYYIFDNIGVETESFIADYEFDGLAIDRASVNLLFRAPVGENVAFIPFGGGSRDLQDDAWAFHVGLRSEVRVYKGLWASADGRWMKQETEDWALFSGGLSYKF